MEVFRIESDGLFRVKEIELSSEKSLENYLIRAEGAQIGGVNILYIDQQGSPGDGGIFDIVGLDEQGDVVILELKRGRSPRDMVAQALEYAASIRSETYEDLKYRYQEFVGDNDVSLRTKHTAFFNREDDPLSEREYNTNQRLLLVGAEFTDLSLDMADFLREHGIDVICVTYSSFASEQEDLRLLTTESVRRPLSEEPASVMSGRVTSHGSIIDVLDGETVIKTVEERNQSDAMEAVVNYLIDHHSLLEKIEIPYIPDSGGGDKALLNETPTHPNGTDMGSYRELSNGYVVLTKLDGASKRRYIKELAQRCGLNARVEM